MWTKRRTLWIPLALGALALMGATWAALIGPVAAKDGSLVGAGTSGTVGSSDSPHRYVVLSPARRPRLTVIARIERDGGRIDRWWNLRGAWAIPAGAYDQRGAGLSGDEGTLVLNAVAYGDPRRAQAQTRLAVLDTRVHLRHPLRPGEDRPEHAVRRITLAGRFEVTAVSADGGVAYLGERGPLPRPGRHPVESGFGIRKLDLDSGRLVPGALRNRAGRRVALAGSPIARTTDPAGRWAYTLYIDERNQTFVLGIDTESDVIARVDLPRESFSREPFGTRLRIDEEGDELEVLRPGIAGLEPLRTVSLPIAAAAEPQPLDPDFLAFTQTPRRPENLLGRVGIAGRTAAGRPVQVRQIGDPGRAGELVVFECLEGEPCDAGHLRPNAFGCPDPYADVYVVPSRVPESESDIAGDIVRELTPAATVWVHQSGRPTGVRAWGAAVPAARRLAERTGLRFRLAPVLAGSAEEWLARDLPDAARISVDLPPGRLANRQRMRLNRALALLGREVSKDGDIPRKG